MSLIDDNDLENISNLSDLYIRMIKKTLKSINRSTTTLFDPTPLEIKKRKREETPHEPSKKQCAKN